MGTIYGTHANVRKFEAYASMSASRRTANTVYSNWNLKAIEERVLANVHGFTGLLGVTGKESQLNREADDDSSPESDIRQKDMFYTVRNTTDPKTGAVFSRKDLWLESMLALADESDTTSAAMCGTFFYLTHHPAAPQVTHREVRATFTHEEEISIYTLHRNARYSTAPDEFRHGR
ncbi:hypothetical protein BJX61DRAFT_547157 [Aspergillus egyptiacus]|nr:hypothetical protein BJX61DRAFT_547157 [Aspergillus egyptiacus]